MCLLGLFVIVQPGINGDISAELPLFSVLMALLGAFGSSVAYVIVRKLSQVEDSSVIIFLLSAGGTAGFCFVDRK